MRDEYEGDEPGSARIWFEYIVSDLYTGFYSCDITASLTFVLCALKELPSCPSFIYHRQAAYEEGSSLLAFASVTALKKWK